MAMQKTASFPATPARSGALMRNPLHMIEASGVELASQLAESPRRFENAR
jgi:hypothetical protein